jgi:hypothetical protein
MPRPPPAPAPPPPPACDRARFDACTTLEEPIRLTGPDERGQDPDLVWTGSELLVVFWHTTGAGADGKLTALDLDGRVLFTDVVPAVNGVRIAWNPRIERGLVLGSWSAQWLGADRRPFGERYRVVPEAANSSVAPTEHGFLLASGRNSATGELMVSTAGTEPAELRWRTVAGPGQRFSSSMALDAFGRAQWLWSHRELFRVLPDGELGELFPVSPAHDDHEIPHDVVTLRDRVIATRHSGHRSAVEVLSFEDGREAHRRLVLERMGSPNSALLRLGDEVLLFSSSLSRDYTMAAAPLDIDTLELGPDVLQVGDEGPAVSHSARAAIIPGGFAVVWSQGDGGVGLHTRLQIADCCVH